MKIREYIATSAKPFFAFVKAWGPLLLNLLIIILGFLSAISVFRVLANNVSTSQKGLSKHDTVYVQLLNAGQLNSVSRDSTGGGRQPTHQEPAANRERTPYPSAENNQNFTGDPITDPMKESSSESYMANSNGYKWWIIALSTIAALLLCFYVVYYYLPPYHFGMRKIIDPEPLKKEFKEHSEEIQSLGNPRKIKRFSNKVRFQYHYLEKKKLHTEQNIQVLFKLLLYFEKQNLMSPLNDEITESIKGGPQAFTEFFKSISIHSPDKNFMRVMYALNKSSFF